MIQIKNQIFHLSTRSTSLVLRVDENQHLLTEHYGAHLPFMDDYTFILQKFNFVKGSEVVYHHDHPSLSLDSQFQEYSTHGKGDFKEPALIIQKEASFVVDFLYDSHELVPFFITEKHLPLPHDPDEVLLIHLVDKIAQLKLTLQYGIFENANVISKNVILTNLDNKPIIIDKIMSLQLELFQKDYELINLYGGWAAENQLSKTSLKPGIYINDSKTGSSSARHNPFFMLKEKNASFNHGDVYSFNLMYSGNHYAMIEVTSFECLRIQNGINPFMFHYSLKENESFISPFAIMTYSREGMNKASQNMHNFVNYHVIRKPFAHKLRPVVLNNWEATYFKFNEAKLLALLKKGKQFGAEVLVLDDGWFGRRSDDTKGLGDYEVNKKKLPHGLNGLAKKVNQAGLKFGLWFEPEMVNENSRLFELHPEYAIVTPQRTPSLGRNQLVLDLSLIEVQDYIIENIRKVLNSANIEYVKWDMNRHITDFTSIRYNQGEIYHRYILGLYRVLDTLMSEFPHVLWEGCSSGGNRFDLGMLNYFSQIWTSDNTDGYARINIQSGLSLGYPLSSFTAHVSGNISHSLLRQVPLETRLNVAYFANFGLELDLTELNRVDSSILKKGLAFYKKYRQVFQYGTFSQLGSIDEGRAIWMVRKEDISLIGNFYGLGKILEPLNTLQGYGFMDEEIYEISQRRQGHKIKNFGSLINHVSPIHLKQDGLILNALDKNMTVEQLMKATPPSSFIAPGSSLNNGVVKLYPGWGGNGYNKLVTMMGDFASQVFIITQKK